MRKHGEELFRIGEVSKITGASRKAILIYEEKGLLTPALKDEESGYRYYSAENMTEIYSIRSLQALGLTLKEISEYYYDTKHIDAHLERLTALRTELDKNIRMLQIRSARQGDLTVHKTILPRQVCFCRQYQCRDTAEATKKLRDTYIAAVRTGKISLPARIFTVRMSQNPDALSLMFCIPVVECYDGPERTVFPETQALCIYYRGPYEGIPAAIEALTAHGKNNGIALTGLFRSIYLEGPPNRGTNTSDYITQIAVPIRG